MPLRDAPDRAEWSAADIERIAEAAHEVFCSAMRARGHVWGAVTDPERKIHDALRPWTDLTEAEKTPSRHLAASLPDKLKYAGYAIVHAPPANAPVDFPPDLLEQLAEDEHARWVRAKLADGWRYAPVTDKGGKEHQSIIRWSLSRPPSPGGTYSRDELAALGPGELSEEEREKDRVIVRGIPRMLARVGLTVRRAAAAGTPVAGDR